MMKTKAIAITALLSLALLSSGCGPKTVYLPCKAEEPLRTSMPDCAYDGNMTKLSKCAAVKYLQLEGDYNTLLTRFRSCK